MSVPTMNDFNNIYIRENILAEVYEKYFEKVNAKMFMSVNKRTIEMEKQFTAVAGYIAKEYFAYKTIFENVTLKELYEDLKPAVEHFNLKMVDYSLLSNFLRGGHKKKVNELTRTLLLDRILSEVFLTPKLRRRVHAVVEAEWENMLPVLTKMEDVYYELHKADIRNVYRKPVTRVSDSGGRPQRYRQSEVKNMPEKGYEYGAVEGSYKWAERDALDDKMDTGEAAVTRFRKRGGK